MNDTSEVCQTCLSNDRLLFPLDELQHLIRDIGLWEVVKLQGAACWECKGAMRKFYMFKCRVREAQATLHYGAQPIQLSTLSTLACVTKNYYDTQFYNNFDPLDGDLGSDVKVIKEELSCDAASDCGRNYESEDDDKPILELRDNKIPKRMYVDMVRAKRNKRCVKDKRKRDKMKKIHKRPTNEFNVNSDDELKEKFATVVFTEEQMIQSRLEKKNQPNFKKIPFKCDSCVLGFTRRETYDLHMEKRHDEKIGNFICDVCKIRFSKEKSVTRHRRKHFVCYRCRLCKYETVELWSALSHCRAKHRADTRDRIHCPQCAAVAKTPEDLSEHIKSQHTLYCNECGEKFKGKNTLRTHQRRIHVTKRDFTCDFCSKTFNTKSRLESHMVSHDSNLAKKLAYCNICNVQYKNIYVYRNHVKNSVNHAVETYQCSECNKKFASKVYWKKHYNFYHLKKSQFKCDVCNKLFISEYSLKNHRQLHHGLSRSRNYPCNDCGKKFFTMSTLKGHQLTHSEERTYMCEDCGDTFKQRPALYTHARLVHKGVKRRARIGNRE